MSEAQKLDSFNKPTPLQLRQRHSLNIANLAHKAHVSSSVVYDMMMKQPVEREEAIKVLEAISTLTEQTYTLDNVQVAFYPDLSMLQKEEPAHCDICSDDDAQV